MHVPLAEDLRPTSLDEFFGQEQALQKKGLLCQLLTQNKPLSVLFWGPPGCGKTTLAKIYLRTFEGNILFFHPATHALSDLKKWVHTIEESPLFYPKNLLFIDEIHRLTAPQQDALLPFVEKGVFSLVGATTENPSFTLSSALLSRIRIIALEPLSEDALEKIMLRAFAKKNHPLPSRAIQQYLVQDAKGDARHLLGNIEILCSIPEMPENAEEVSWLLSKKFALYDAQGNCHFSYISALHKSIRGSDADAAVYWICRMLEGGEDRNYIGRRLLRIAIEDIGLADMQAQQVALQAWQTYERLGSPEGDLALVQAAIFLALSPKSIASYQAYQEGTKLSERTSQFPPPSHLLPNASNYQYDPDMPEGISHQRYFPQEVPKTALYRPKEIGREKELKRRKEFFERKNETAYLFTPQKP